MPHGTEIMGYDKCDTHEHTYSGQQMHNHCRLIAHKSAL